MATIRIESVLGGHAPTSHFAARDQFRASLGIDPAQPIDDLNSAVSTVASGLIRPAASEFCANVGAAPLWIVPNPKDANHYILDALGSAYSFNASFTTLTGLSDGGSLSLGKGNGAEYGDNYIYFAKNTTVARYGPLNGTPAFDGNYWAGTLSKTALTDTTYPTSNLNAIEYPNHFLHRHSDGRVYILDVVGNLGTVHFIKTTKTTVEGDTDDGSTYSALTLGYGLHPTVAESYTSDLAIAVYEGSGAVSRQPRAKIAFWDTTSTNFNKITWVEYPDTIITAMKNVDGILYVVSGNINAQGWRLTRFIGGYTFEEVYYSETGEPCMPDAIDAVLRRVLVGTHTTVPESDGCVYSVGLQKEALGDGIFNIMRATGANASTTVTAVLVADNNDMGFFVPIIGWTKGSGTSNNAFDKQGTGYMEAPSVWWSQMYRIGKPFRIQAIRLPFAQAMATGMTLTPTIYVDDGSSSFTGASYGLPALNNTVLPNSERYANLKIANVSGQHNFFLGLKWTGINLLTVNLPIEIDYEVIEDQ